MKRIFTAGAAVCAVFLISMSRADAQGHQCSPCPQYGCGGFCLHIFGKITQEGPLFNYGPYAGYYPFEPYGPWNAQLQYTGPYPTYGECGWYHHHHHGCSSCGNSWASYARVTWTNVFHRLHPFAHHHGASINGCGSCGGGGCSASAILSADKAIAMSEIDQNVQPTSHAQRER